MDKSSLSIVVYLDTKTVLGVILTVLLWSHNRQLWCRLEKLRNRALRASVCIFQKACAITVWIIKQGFLLFTVV